MVIMSRSQEKLKKVEDEISEYLYTHARFVLIHVHVPPSSLSFSLSLTYPSFFTHTFTHTYIHTHTPHSLVEQKYSREVRIIPVDFSDGMEIYPSLAEQLKDMDIGVLSKFTPE